METVIDVIKAVSYDALNEEQKVGAIEVMRDINNQDTTPYWSVDITDEWKAKLDSEYGIADAVIYWSGFSSQGDGASISTDCNIDLETFLRKLKVWSKYRSLHRIIADSQITATVNRGSSHYYHENTVSGCIEQDYCIEFTPKQVLAIEVLEEFLTDTIRDLSRTLYKELDNENDYHSSDEAFWATIEANEYSFEVNSAGEVLGLA